jgi:hypothetical protein
MVQRPVAMKLTGHKTENVYHGIRNRQASRTLKRRLEGYRKLMRHVLQGRRISRPAARWQLQHRPSVLTRAGEHQCPQRASIRLPPAHFSTRPRGAGFVTTLSLRNSTAEAASRFVSRSAAPA